MDEVESDRSETEGFLQPSPLGSVAKPRVLNDSPVDCQTPRCPSPQARQGDHAVVDEVESDTSNICALYPLPIQHHIYRRSLGLFLYFTSFKINLIRLATQATLSRLRARAPRRKTILNRFLISSVSLRYPK